MAQSTGYRRPDMRLVLHVPGWLLILGLLAVVGYFISTIILNAMDSDTSLGGPVRVTVLDTSTASGILSADLILESNEALADPTNGWSVQVDHGPCRARCRRCTGHWRSKHPRTTHPPVRFDTGG